MSLSPRQIEQFQTEGYTSEPAFFTPREVDALRLELEHLRREGRFRNVCPGSQQEDNKKENLQLLPIYDKSRLFRALPFAPKVLEAVGSLIGERFLLHLDQVFLKPARHGSGTSWHQDNAYFKIADPMKGTAMWIAVHEATVANGTMHIIPRMMSEQLEHSRDPMSDHHIRCYPDESKAVPLELPAGGVAFFAYGTPHCTRANTTEKDRAGVALHFLHQDYAKPDLVLPDRRMRPYLSGPRATGGVTEYGVKVAGTWEQEVEQVLEREGVAA